MASEAKRARRREWRANTREHWSNERIFDRVEREALRWGIPLFSWNTREEYDQRLGTARVLESQRKDPLQERAAVAIFWRELMQTNRAAALALMRRGCAMTRGGL